MAAARGDRRPCTRAGCSGIMQFGREPLSPGPAARAAEGERGWICSAQAGHFQRESEHSASEAGARGSARAGWRDDGGAEMTATSERSPSSQQEARRGLPVLSQK
jgi:hypothetical protein